MDSKEYSWAWVTASRMLTDVPCELVMVSVVPSGTTTDTIVYDGTNTKGDQITQFNITIVLNWDFTPSVPIYCRKGLYVTVGTNVTGVFILWRNL
jgi:hypothetical protein